jgi:hypothetical protein
MTNYKQERAQKVWEAYEAEDTYNFPKDGVVAAIREVINQLQYDNTDWDAPDDHMIIDVKDILRLIEELEAL